MYRKLIFSLLILTCAIPLFAQSADEVITYSTEDDALVVTYPTSWILEETSAEHGIVYEMLLRSPLVPTLPNRSRMFIQIRKTGQTDDYPTGLSAIDYLDRTLSIAFDAEMLTIGNRDYAKAEVEGQDGSKTMIVSTLLQDDWIVLASLVVATDDRYEQQQSEFETVLANLKFNAEAAAIPFVRDSLDYVITTDTPELTQQFSEENNGLSFSYPAGSTLEFAVLQRNTVGQTSIYEFNIRNQQQTLRLLAWNVADSELDMPRDRDTASEALYYIRNRLDQPPIAEWRIGQYEVVQYNGDFDGQFTFSLQDNANQWVGYGMIIEAQDRQLAQDTLAAIIATIDYTRPVNRIESSDSSLTFVLADGWTIAEFRETDGVAYQYVLRALGNTQAQGQLQVTRSDNVNPDILSVTDEGEFLANVLFAINPELNPDRLELLTSDDGLVIASVGIDDPLTPINGRLVVYSVDNRQWLVIGVFGAADQPGGEAGNLMIDVLLQTIEFTPPE